MVGDLGTCAALLNGAQCGWRVDHHGWASKPVATSTGNATVSTERPCQLAKGQSTLLDLYKWQVVCVVTHPPYTSQGEGQRKTAIGLPDCRSSVDRVSVVYDDWT